MSKKYFMVDQVKPRARINFPEKKLFFMNTGVFLVTIIVLSASAFYIK